MSGVRVVAAPSTSPKARCSRKRSASGSPPPPGVGGRALGVTPVQDGMRARLAPYYRRFPFERHTLALPSSLGVPGEVDDGERKRQLVAALLAVGWHPCEELPRQEVVRIKDPLRRHLASVDKDGVNWTQLTGDAP